MWISVDTGWGVLLRVSGEMKRSFSRNRRNAKFAFDFLLWWNIKIRPEKGFLLIVSWLFSNVKLKKDKASYKIENLSKNPKNTLFLLSVLVNCIHWFSKEYLQAIKKSPCCWTIRINQSSSKTFFHQVNLRYFIKIYITIDLKLF